jgi:membrane protease YdiL (CAAX protease family)
VEPTELQRLLFGLLLLAGGATLAPVGVELARRLSPGRRVFFARWGFSHAALVLAVGVVAMFAAQLVFAAGAPGGTGGTGAEAGTEEPAAGGLLPLLLTQGILLAAAAAAFLAARACEPNPLQALGLRTGGNLRALACALACFVLAWPAVHGAYEVWRYAAELLPGEPWEPQGVVQAIAALEGGELFVAAFLAIVVAPFLEEVLFRGFLQPLLVQNLSDVGGIVVTSLLFATLHGRAAFLPIFVLSLVIGGVMLRTQRLAAAWLVHALNNSLSLAVIFLARDLLLPP